MMSVIQLSGWMGMAAMDARWGSLSPKIFYLADRLTVTNGHAHAYIRLARPSGLGTGVKLGHMKLGDELYFSPTACSGEPTSRA
jgi:hypothetical protein